MYSAACMYLFNLLHVDVQTAYSPFIVNETPSVYYHASVGHSLAPDGRPRPVAAVKRRRRKCDHR